MKEDRTNHVLAAIDGALEDWSVSGDAMRWNPEPDKPPTPYAPAHTILTLPAQYQPAQPPSWLAGMRVIEDPGVNPGEVVLSVERDLVERPWDAGDRVMFRIAASIVRTEARVCPGLDDHERAALIERMADAYGVPPCLIEHRWGPWVHYTGTARRACQRYSCRAWQDQEGGYEPPLQP